MSDPLYYRFVPIFEGAKPGNESIVEGELDDCLVVSVPSHMGPDAVETLAESMRKQFTKPLLIISHNIEFCRMERLSSQEAEDLARRAENASVGAGSGASEGGGGSIGVDAQDSVSPRLRNIN